MSSYLLDEHIPSAYRTQLVYHDPSLTVLMIGDEGVLAKSTPDPEILHWCEQNDFMLVTNNRKSMPGHLADHLAAGHHVPGIITIDLNAPMGNCYFEGSEFCVSDIFRSRGAQCL